MCCREVRKPIAFYIPELNIEFRCSYMLTNMKLETAAEIYTDVHKKSGQLQYEQAFSTESELTDHELEYCEYDIICLYEIIKYYRDKYEHIAKIPLTQTGTVRKRLKKVVDFYYIRKMWSLVPPPDKYLLMMSCFSGGYTHTNILRAGTVQHNASSWDIASSYPSCFFYKFPCEVFRWCINDEFLSKPDSYAYIVHVKFKNVKNKYYNTYIQKSKCFNTEFEHVIWDNGRMMSCDGSFEMTLSDVDYNIITTAYHGEVEILECWKARKKYLDVRILKFILQLYSEKTTLKGLKADNPADQEIIEDRYKSAKECLNSCYGVSVSNILNNSSDFKDGIWYRNSFSAEFVKDKLDESRHSWSTLFQYSTGLYITAYARANVFLTLLQLDSDVIYCDTDSIKYVGQHDDVFQKFNESVLARYQAVCDYYPAELHMNDFRPIDAKGVQHTLGFFECENNGNIEEFLALGAKKYCYRVDGELHLTMSGVKKSAVKYLDNDINNFKNGFKFGYKESGKLIHYYEDNMQPVDYVDKDGNAAHSDLRYGVVLQPTSYTIGITDLYEELMQMVQQDDVEIDYTK